ncbi:unnamed protein product [Amoebophrya sp. A25]|nr:unnamed protein product [Amoebophrya sp. A25]|eukprot:GSA25T00019945001.1
MTPTGKERAYISSPLGQTRKETHAHMQQELATAAATATLPEPQESLTALAGRLSATLTSLSQEVGHPQTPPPEMASGDISEAYYLFGIDDPKSCPITGHDPRQWACRFWVSYTLNMGAEPSVPAFCRLSELLMAICIYFKVPVLAYIDDQNYFAATTQKIFVARTFVHQLAACPGLPLSKKPAADQSSARADTLKALGLIYHYTRSVDATLLTLMLPSNYYIKLTKAFDTTLTQIKSRSLVLKDLQRLVGLATFGTQHTRSKIGTELLRPLYKWLGEPLFHTLKKCKKRRSMLRIHVVALQHLLPNLPRITHGKTASRITQSYLATDASSDGGPDGQPVLGAFHINAQGKRQAFTVLIDRQHIENVFGNTICIEVLEAMATYLALTTWATANDFMHISLDNVTQLYARVKMAAKSSHLLNIITKSTLRAASAEQRTFYRYVSTHFNIADIFSREDCASFRHLLAEVIEVRQPNWTIVLKTLNQKALLPEVTDSGPDTRKNTQPTPLPAPPCDNQPPTKKQRK